MGRGTLRREVGELGHTLAVLIDAYTPENRVLGGFTNNCRLKELWADASDGVAWYRVH